MRHLQPATGLSGGRSVLFRSFFLNRDDVQARNGDAAIIIEPDDHATAMRMDASVIGARDAIAIPTARDDGEGLKRPRRQVVTNIRDHLDGMIPKDCALRKRRLPS
jgi:hypothetical protein